LNSSSLQIAVIGCGRIGRIHASNLARRIPNACLAAVADLNPAAAKDVAAQFNVPRVATDARSLLADPLIDAVAICSATDTHAELIEQTAAAGKHIFCEKPIDLNLARIRRALEVVAKAGVKFQLGFNRRFDPSFAQVKAAVTNGKIGTPHIVRITSRDPAPPPLEYIRVSGGLPLDMAIHDFDMVRFLTGQEAEEIYAVGAALIDPEIGRTGDVDTCVITMRLIGGGFATIDNSRQAAYGYDQRVEVFGSAGVVSAGNRKPDSHTLLDGTGEHSAKPLHFFLERYQEAYLIEMQEFVRCLLEDRSPSVTGQDGWQAAILGVAAKRSIEERRPVKIAEISQG
jgi:myo-inositol 2-dehydrogenase / D-chiro-inositol 1-dehydrogenase